MKEKIIKKIVEVSQKEKGRKERLLSFIPQFVFFIIFLPLILFILPYFFFDNWFGFERLKLTQWMYITIAIITLIGWIFAIWSIVVQFKLGKGTPAPVMATQKLVIKKPFSLCRNPMAFGTLLLYIGTSLLIGSISAIIMSVLFIIVLLTYIKTIEEKELEIRFGQEYTEYKKNTPFIFPYLF